MKPLVIKLRDVDYIADDPAIAEVQALVTFLLMGHTEELQLEAIAQAKQGKNHLLGLDITDPEQLEKVSRILFIRSQPPEARAAIARCLCLLFPTLPQSIAVLNGERTRLKLEFVELLNDVLMPVSRWLEDSKGESIAPAVEGDRVETGRRKGRSRKAPASAPQA
jgi:hypothetical protein